MHAWYEFSTTIELPIALKWIASPASTVKGVFHVKGHERLTILLPPFRVLFPRIRGRDLKKIANYEKPRGTR